MASAKTSLPYGTILRYKAVGEQPQRTMLVLENGQLRCLRVGERTWKGNQLPTYPSLKAFLDIIPAHEQEEFTVEWGNLINEDLLAAKMRDTLKCMGIRDDDDPQRIYSFCEGYTEMSVEMAEENKAACERYLQSLGLTAGESAEGGYIFYREVKPAIAPPPWDESIYSPTGYYYDDEPLTEDEHALAKASWEYHQKVAVLNEVHSRYPHLKNRIMQRIQPPRACKKA